MLKEKISIRIFEKLPFPPKKTSFPYCDFCKYRRYLYTYRRYLCIFRLKIKKYRRCVKKLSLGKEVFMPDWEVFLRFEKRIAGMCACVLPGGFHPPNLGVLSLNLLLSDKNQKVFA